jgi:hypothetical protein
MLTGTTALLFMVMLGGKNVMIIIGRNHVEGVQKHNGTV